VLQEIGIEILQLLEVIFAVCKDNSCKLEKLKTRF